MTSNNDQANLELFHTWLRKNLSEATTNTYYRATKGALKLDSDNPIASLLRPGLSRQTRNTYQAALRQWALFTEDAELLDKLNSKELLRAFKDDLKNEHQKAPHEVQPFSPEEEARLLKVLGIWQEDATRPQWQWPAISMMFNLGLRAGVDLMALSRADVEAALRSKVELVIATKGAKNRRLPAVLILAEMQALLEADRPWEVVADLIVAPSKLQSPRKLQNAYELLRLCIKQLAREAEIPENELHTHRFRHNAAQRLFAITKDMKMVQEFLGHNSMNTTMGYLKKNRTEEIGSILLAARPAATPAATKEDE